MLLLLKELTAKDASPPRSRSGGYLAEMSDMDSVERGTKRGRAEWCEVSSESTESVSLYLCAKAGTLVLFSKSSNGELLNAAFDFLVSFCRIFRGKLGDRFPLLIVVLLKGGAEGSESGIPSNVCICVMEVRN